MRRIEIDDEIYAELEKHVKGFEQPNDVLRRLILGRDEQSPAVRRVSPPHGSRGSLYGLLKAGKISAGDELVHVQPRKGRTFVATVDADGFILTSVDRYAAPSPALRDLVGSEINGKANWVHKKTGMTLKELGA